MKTVKRKPKIDEPTIPYQEPPSIEEMEEEVDVPEPTAEPEPVYVAPKPTKQEQINKLLKEHPAFLGSPTMKYYGEVLYPWLHKLEQLLE